MRLVLIFAGLVIPQLLYLLFQLRRRSIQTRRFIENNNCKATGPSYPHKPFLFGLDWVFENAVNIYHHRFAIGVRERFDRYGATHTAQVFHKKAVNTIDPENLRAMLRTNFDDYTIIVARKKLMRILFGVGIFGTEGDDWKHSRQLVRNSVSNFHLDCDTFETHFQQLLQGLRAQGGRGKTVDFKKLAYEYTYGVATDIVIGKPTSETDKANFNITPSQQDGQDQFGRDFTRLREMSKVLTIAINQIPYLANIVYPRSYKSTQTRISKYIDSRIQQIQSQRHPHDDPKHNPTYLETLTTQTTNQTRIRSETLHLFLATHDTNATAISELFWLLSRSPQTYHKLRHEILTHFPPPSSSSPPYTQPIPSLPSLKSLPYLSAILNETLRLQPTLSVHGRLSTRDTILPRGGGPTGADPLFIPAKTYVIYSNYALHRDTTVFGPDVDQFRPERWQELTRKPDPFEFLAFGAGPRGCPGRELGWNTVAYLLVRVVQCVKEMRGMDERGWEEGSGFSFWNANGVLVEMVLDDGGDDDEVAAVVSKEVSGRVI